MRFKTVLTAVGLLFILFSTNAYACLFSMGLAGPAEMAMPSMAMPMDGPMPSPEDSAMPCPTVQCDALTSQRSDDPSCLLSSAAATLSALNIAKTGTPAVSLYFAAPAAIERPPDIIRLVSIADPPRPLHSVSLLLLHSVLLL